VLYVDDGLSGTVALTKIREERRRLCLWRVLMYSGYGVFSESDEGGCDDSADVGCDESPDVGVAERGTCDV
jgi:hypothetical protein